MTTVYVNGQKVRKEDLDRIEIKSEVVKDIIRKYQENPTEEK